MRRRTETVAFEPGSALWHLLRDDPDPLRTHPSVTASLALAGGDPSSSNHDCRGIRRDFKMRRLEPVGTGCLRSTTETWREHVPRRQRCSRFAEARRGEVHEINDLITLNLNLRQFAEDVISVPKDRNYCGPLACDPGRDRARPNLRFRAFCSRRFAFSNHSMKPASTRCRRSWRTWIDPESRIPRGNSTISAPSWPTSSVIPAGLLRPEVHHRA